MTRISMTLLLLLLVAGFGLPVTANSDTPRIISAGGSITEVIYALGRGDWVVATDNTSSYPEPAGEVTKLGYFRQLSTEGVLAQHPTHLIGADATGPDIMLKQVASAGVQVSVLHQPRNLAGLLSVIRDVGDIVNAETAANRLIERIQREVTEQKQRFLNDADTTHSLRALFIVANNDRGLTVAGQNTVPQALFSELNIVNIAESIEGYKLIDNETVLAGNPDFILVAGHMLHGESALQKLCSQKAVAATFAGKHCLVQSIDSSIGLGLSPRFADALGIVADQAKTAIRQKQTASTAGLYP
ncbi:heme/hemin ABC transporter substrate-binding protein [Alteromonas antoniana]|uniref:heme/hemin ABC transporter substrate-binding protein n=1 Tax=Alteromonas antoniana TaxID=2803813 RepID=UPI001C44E0DC|nr:ABC transporter substrate-binding protein [Alteromonas antoniana]